MSSWEGATLREEPNAWALSFAAVIPAASTWLTPGWEMAGTEDVRFPTFMRALPKKKETYLPSGIQSTPADARKRWKEDAWRYPPYQYKMEFCIRRKRAPFELRLLCAEEREALMFLGNGATRYALNPTKAKADLVALEDCRCALIGNFFRAGVSEWF